MADNGLIMTLIRQRQKDKQAKQERAAQAQFMKNIAPLVARVKRYGADAAPTPEELAAVCDMAGISMADGLTLMQGYNQTEQSRRAARGPERLGRDTRLQNIFEHGGREVAGPGGPFPGRVATPQDSLLGTLAQEGQLLNEQGKTFAMPQGQWNPNATPVPPKPDFTLGDTRYTGEGKPIVTRTPTPKPPKKVELKSWDLDGTPHTDYTTIAEYKNKRKELETLGRVFREPLAKKKLKGEIETKGLKGLASRYQTQIGRYYAAKRGTGQFIADPNKEQVAAEALQSAENIAAQYVKKGGKAEDLGITAESIRADFKAGRIDEKKAIHLLQQLFGMK